MMTFGIPLVVLFMVAALPATLGKPHMPSPHVQNALTAEPHSHPWLLSMKYSGGIFSNDQHFCGASLIRVSYSNDSSDIAITAAHCIGNRETHACEEHKRPVWMYELVASDHDQVETDIGEISATVLHSVCHPKWKPPSAMKTDIAVLKLSKPLKFSKTIQPIDLPRQGEEVPKDAKCITAGWGDTEYTFNKTTGQKISRGTPRHLQEIPVHVATSDECFAIWTEVIANYSITKNESINTESIASIAREYTDRDTHLCNRVTNNRTVLPGDSGSALVCRRGDEKVLYGIVSMGATSPWQPYAGNFYAKVSAYADWIEEQIGQWNVV